MTYSEPAPASSDSSARVLSILGIVFGVVAILFIPILFGPAGIICAAIALRKGDPLAKTALMVAIVGMLAGFALGALVFASK